MGYMSVNSIGRIDLGRGEAGYDIDSMQQVAGHFVEVVDLGDSVYFVDDLVERRLDFGIGLFREKRSLSFEATSVAQELLAVEL